MSQEQTMLIKDSTSAIAKVAKPILLRKENKIKIFHGECSNQLLLKNMKLGPLYKDSLIFESKPGGFIGNSPVKVSIVNRIDLLKKTTKTVITYYDQLNGKELSVKTSDRIARFIGQNNYETVLNAICSIKEEEIKVNAIMALLTNELLKDGSTQTTYEEPDLKPTIIKVETTAKMEERSCQTDDNCMDLIFKFKQRKRIKRSVLTPYVVKDPPKKVIKKCIVNLNTEQVDSKPISCSDGNKPSQITMHNGLEHVDVEASSRIPELQLSDSESVDNLTLNGSLCGDAFLQPGPLFKSLDIHTASKEGTMVTVLNSEKHYIKLPNGKQIEVCVKPEFPFHMATPDILKTLSNEDKVTLVNYQAFLDFKCCLERDSDGYLPIHNAVINNDVDLLRRQCVVLRYRQQSLDITANNLTALQMSIYQDTPQCTALLIQHGADPLLTDEEHRTCLHLASESSLDNLRAVIKNCEDGARAILQEHEELWKPEYETKTKEELAAILLKHICEMHDSEGYTPLMISAKSGNYSGVKTLLEAWPECINQTSPNNGNTALFFAVEGACHDATNRGNKSKVADNFYQTISILLQNGAENNVSNYSGTTINELLADNGNAELSLLLANKAASNKFFANETPKKFDSYMLVKEESGEISLEMLNKRGGSKSNIKKPISNIKNPLNDDKASKIGEAIVKKEKPIILENISVAQSPAKVFIIDPRGLNTVPHIIIGPNDKLITNRNKKSDIKIVTPQQSANISLKPSAHVVSKVKELASMQKHNDVSKQEALKRKSINGPGPKSKVHKTI